MNAVPSPQAPAIKDDSGRDAAPARPPSAFSVELVLVIGLPILSLVVGAVLLALAYGHAWTPLPAAAPVALHGS